MPEQSAEDKAASDLAVLFPGQEIVVETEAGKLSWKVFPVSLRHLRRFSKAVGRVLTTATTLQVNVKGSFEEKAAAIMPSVIPIIIEDLIDLVAECVKQRKGQPEVDVRDLPHWLAAPVVEAWIMQSFGTEAKLRPWVAAVESVIGKVSGNKPRLWEKLSRSSSPPATA